ncbi:hypothetical protein LINGRAHAP2_LOCUS30701 [Linum grandiflorum]
MQCSYHPIPYRNNPGGICAFCLQEKLGKLVSSSSSSFPVRPSTSSNSSSPSTSFRSEVVPPSAAATSLVRPSSTLSHRPSNINHNNHGYIDYCSSLRMARIQFLLAKKKKKKKQNVVFKRSKSTAAATGTHFLDKDGDDQFSPRNRKRGGGFWSFFYHSTSSSSSAAAVANKKINREMVVVVEEENDSPGNSQATAASASSFERKVSRSRSVGCGSRSFSGDFFERISTGFGDCTLRRVESHRPPPPPPPQRVKCGGIFGGFIISSSSSSSSSSSYWVSDSTAANNGIRTAKSWTNWAFASPITAFNFTNKTKTCGASQHGKRDHLNLIRETGNTNSAPNLPC